LRSYLSGYTGKLAGGDRWLILAGGASSDYTGLTVGSISGFGVGFKLVPDGNDLYAEVQPSASFFRFK